MKQKLYLTPLLFILIVSVAYASGGLVSHVTFDDGNVVGKIGQARSFNGVDNSLDLGDMPELENVSAATWSFWINPAVLSPGTPIIAKYKSNNSEISWKIAMDLGCGGGSNDIVIFIGSSGSCATTKGDFLSVGQWRHVAIVYDGTLALNAEKIKIYIDGVSKPLSYAGTLASQLPATLSSVVVGAHSNLLGSFFGGTLDDLQIYSRALSPEEIGGIYQPSGEAVIPPPSIPTTPATTTPTTPEIITPVIPPVIIPSNPSGEIIPEDRRISWTEVGIPGGVPSNTIYIDFRNEATKSKYNVYPNDEMDDAPGIVKAIADASQASLLSKTILNTSDTIRSVYLPEGTYDIKTFLTFGRVAGVALRGAGPGKTILAVKMTGIGIGTGGYGLSTSDRQITSGYTKGSTSLTVSDASGITPGTILQITQSNDPDFMWHRSGAEGLLKQEAIVTAVNGNTLTISPALVWPPQNWNSIVPPNPRFRYQTVKSARFSGMEDLSVVGNPNLSAYLMWIQGTYAFWIKNIESSFANGYNIYISNNLRTEIRDSFIHDTYSTSDGYGIECYTLCTGLLIENNIFKTHFNSLILSDLTNAVIAYNYSTNARYVPWPTNLVADFNANHGPHDMMLLWEGNIGAQWENDGYHGSGSHQTLFRNNFTALHADPAHVNNRRAVSLNRFSYYHNIIGNVLGFPGWPVSSGYYEIELKDYGYNIPTIYRLGYPNLGNNAYTPGNPVTDPTAGGYDPKVKATLLRHGNFDYQTNSTIWDPAISNHTLPASLYLSGKPAWFGSITFPPIGPDVSGMVNKIPAQVCYEQGKMPNCLMSTSQLPPPPQTNIVGDFNKDGVVNSIDMSLMSGAWNQNSALYDLNKDGTVNTLDFSVMVRNWTM